MQLTVPNSKLDLSRLHRDYPLRLKKRAIARILMPAPRREEAGGLYYESLEEDWFYTPPPPPGPRAHRKEVARYVRERIESAVLDPTGPTIDVEELLGKHHDADYVDTWAVLHLLEAWGVMERREAKCWRLPDGVEVRWAKGFQNCIVCDASQAELLRCDQGRPRFSLCGSCRPRDYEPKSIEELVMTILLETGTSPAARQRLQNVVPELRWPEILEAVERERERLQMVDVTAEEEWAVVRTQIHREAEAAVTEAGVEIEVVAIEDLEPPVRFTWAQRPRRRVSVRIQFADGENRCVELDRDDVSGGLQPSFAHARRLRYHADLTRASGLLEDVHPELAARLREYAAPPSLR